MKKTSIKNKHIKNLSFNDFCNIESIRYWRQQLNEANVKNIKNESQFGGTKNAYTYGLLRFNNWLQGKKFQYTKTIQTGRNEIQNTLNVNLRGVDHLLLLSMNSSSKTNFIRLIKIYLAEISSTGKHSTLKNAIYSIRSFFQENESDIVFRINSRMQRLTENKPMTLMSLEDLHMILTVKNIQPIEKAVFMCKFQRGLDSATLTDRFNFEAWEQLVEHFKSTEPEEWDVKNTPVPIHLARVKTGFMHTGFLDADAITAIIEYLNIRHEKPKMDRALFVNKTKKPITANWISRRFHKLVKKSGLCNNTGQQITNKYTPHEMRDLLKSTLIDSNCRPDVADHVIGHKPHDSYEKQATLYPESLVHEFAKASDRINIFSRYSIQKQQNTRNRFHIKQQNSWINPKVIYLMQWFNHNMDSLETFVKQSIKEGKDSIEDLDEFQRILDMLDTEEKPLYLKHDIYTNT